MASDKLSQSLIFYHFLEKLLQRLLENQIKHSIKTHSKQRYAYSREQPFDSSLSSYVILNLSWVFILFFYIIDAYGLRHINSICRYESHTSDEHRLKKIYSEPLKKSIFLPISLQFPQKKNHIVSNRGRDKIDDQMHPKTFIKRHVSLLTNHTFYTVKESFISLIENSQSDQLVHKRQPIFDNLQWILYQRNYYTRRQSANSRHVLSKISIQTNKLFYSNISDIRIITQYW